MSNFNTDEEIDKLVDKFSEQLKTHFKRLVQKSEKQILKEYIASQKPVRVTTKTISSRNVKEDLEKNTRKNSKQPPKREIDYRSRSSSSSSSSSDSERSD